MSLLTAVQSAVKVADKVVKPLQSTVTYKRWLGQDGNGDASFASPVQLLAIVDWQQRQVRTVTGLLSVSRAAVTFLDAAALAAATGGAGIGDDDILVLEDGTTGPILDLSGFIDPSVRTPIATTVYLG